MRVSGQSWKERMLVQVTGVRLPFPTKRALRLRVVVDVPSGARLPF